MRNESAETPTYCTSMRQRMSPNEKGRHMKVNVEKEVEGEWLQQGWMCPLLLHLLVFCQYRESDSRGRQKHVSADPNVDMEADTEKLKARFKTRRSKPQRKTSTG